MERKRGVEPRSSRWKREVMSRYTTSACLSARIIPRHEITIGVDAALSLEPFTYGDTESDIDRKQYENSP